MANSLTISVPATPAVACADKDEGEGGETGPIQKLPPPLSPATTGSSRRLLAGLSKSVSSFSSRWLQPSAAPVRSRVGAAFDLPGKFQAAPRPVSSQLDEISPATAAQPEEALAVTVNPMRAPRGEPASPAAAVQSPSGSGGASRRPTATNRGGKSPGEAKQRYADVTVKYVGGTRVVRHVA